MSWLTPGGGWICWVDDCWGPETSWRVQLAVCGWTMSVLVLLSLSPVLLSLELGDNPAYLSRSVCWFDAATTVLGGWLGSLPSLSLAATTNTRPGFVTARPGWSRSTIINGCSWLKHHARRSCRIRNTDPGWNTSAGHGEQRDARGPEQIDADEKSTNRFFWLVLKMLVFPRTVLRPP